MIAIMWRFDVKHGRETEFEQLYGIDGDWTAMNRHARSYLGTSFLHDQNRPSRYVVIEYWSEMLVYEQHRVFRSEAIASLEERSRAIVDSVEPLGIFSALDVPDRRPGRSAVKAGLTCVGGAGNVVSCWNRRILARRTIPMASTQVSCGERLAILPPL